MNLCRLEKIRVLELARYEYDCIVNNTENVSFLSADELNRRKATLEAIEKIMPILAKTEQELKKTIGNV